MFLFGHLGLTAGAVAAYNARAKTPVDLRWALPLSLLPDLVDKPTALAYSHVFHNHTRLFGHSLVFSAAVLLALVLGKRRAAVATWAACAGHLVLDRIWEPVNRWALLWPFGGRSEAMPPIFQRWFESLVQPYNLGGELAGLAVLGWLVARHRLYQRDRAARFVATGLLEA